MMRLLISVVDAAEAAEAGAAGADIIDVKDPTTGALGAAAPQSVREVRTAVPPRLPVSAAMGDGPFRPGDALTAAAALTAAGATFVKLGLRDTPAERALPLLGAVVAGLPTTARLIAVGFADFHRANSPHPLDLPALAQAAGAHGCLIDTAVKDGRGLLHWLGESVLRSFVAQCRSRGLLSALAGSLAPADLPFLTGIGPDIVGVRGAACAGDRAHGRVTRERVAALVVASPGRAASQ
jgi:(5-formylfuran-3-yl)methyl phosphate synthase